YEHALIQAFLEGLAFCTPLFNKEGLLENNLMDEE
ncbi:MAG: hypothetical protein RLZ92_1667, partial [Pseudomonadota bacterium]